MEIKERKTKKKKLLPSRSCCMTWQAWGPPKKAVLAERRIECWGGERRRCFKIKAARQRRVTFRALVELVSNNLRRTKPDNLQDRRKSSDPCCGSLTRFSWTDTRLVSVHGGWTCLVSVKWILWKMIWQRFVRNELCWLRGSCGRHFAVGGEKWKIYVSLLDRNCNCEDIYGSLMAP